MVENPGRVMYRSKSFDRINDVREGPGCFWIAKKGAPVLPRALKNLLTVQSVNLFSYLPKDQDLRNNITGSYIEKQSNRGYVCIKIN